MPSAATVSVLTLLVAAVAWALPADSGQPAGGPSPAEVVTAEVPAAPPNGSTAALPAGMTGFRGIVVGTLQSKGDRDFVLKVDKVSQVWKESTAAEPKAAVGQSIRINIDPASRLGREHLALLKDLKVGDSVEVEAFHLGSACLTVVEALKKVNAAPAAGGAPTLEQLTADNAALRVENARLKAELAALREENRRLREQAAR